MPTSEGIRWFKKEFEAKISNAISNTPFTVDFLTAIACQETGYLWNTLRKQVGTEEVLALCVGDSIDGNGTSGRRAFPRNKAELIAVKDGQQMFDIARKALEDLARYIPAYQGAASNPKKFCRGFGVFQRDLQFFKVDPDYFLQKRYASFDASLQMAIDELKVKLKRLGWQHKNALSDYELACLAIAYNTGGFVPQKGLKQGYKPQGGPYYGEAIFEFIRMSKSVQVSEVVVGVTEQPPKLPDPTPVTSKGRLFEVDVESVLNVRRDPSIPRTKPRSNVVATLTDGVKVRTASAKPVNGFWEIETSVQGALIKGFVSEKHLKLLPSAVTDLASDVVVEQPSPLPPSTGLIAVHMSRKNGTITKRTELANAYSLNEAGQPQRNGATTQERVSQLSAIIKWLAVDKAAHRRYQSRDGMTFCNIYAHDYCHLAGCYLPRVWWTSAAIIKLTQGTTVEPRYGATIDEVRANDLFRWLRDFGLQFGWRQTGTLSKLQLEVNQGAVGLIVARRVEDGRPGHVTLVVPETETDRAKRNASGEVLAPLQSQAGATNSQYSTGKADWWKDARFGEFAFWLHA
jgi:hypothetical protein